MEPAPPTIAIETSGRVGSVALGRGPDLLESQTFSTGLRHAVELLPTLCRLCERHSVHPSEIERVFVSLGPGSFTGLRIGVTVARTISWSAGAKIVGLPTLEVIAQNALDDAHPPPIVGVVLDAKRKNVFAAAFELREGHYTALNAPREWNPADFAQSLPSGAALLGEGIAYHGPALAHLPMRILPERLNRARAETVYRLGSERANRSEFTNRQDLLPIYIRRPEAEEVWERRHNAHS